MIKKPTKGEYLELILRSPQTIFSSKDVALLWGESDRNIIKNRLNKYYKTGKLHRVHRGLYAKDKNYNIFELANKINTPSYISFETVLTREGVNFQYYQSIFVASYINREIIADKLKIKFVRIKREVLSNITGLEYKNGYTVASKERAFLDRLYISKDYHFDNITAIDWQKIIDILPIYKSKRLEKKVQIYLDKYNKINK